MSVKSLMFLTSAVVTAGLVIEPLARQSPATIDVLRFR